MISGPVAGERERAVYGVRMDRERLDNRGVVERVNLRIDRKADSLDGPVFRSRAVQIDEVRHAGDADPCVTGDWLQVV